MPVTLKRNVRRSSVYLKPRTRSYAPGTFLARPLKRPKNPGNRFRDFYGVIRGREGEVISHWGQAKGAAPFPLLRASRQAGRASGHRELKSAKKLTWPVLRPPGIPAYTWTNRKGYANAERAVWAAHPTLSSPLFSSASLSVRRRFSLSYDPSAALRYRQVGSLLRNGFPDFFATIKGLRRNGTRWGMASVCPISKVS